MPLIITPKQLNQRAELYHQLGIMIAAGLSVPKALQHLEANPPSLNLRAPVSRLLNNLNQGFTITESIQKIGRWSPSFDLALIDAGERSGRLDACFKLLASYYQERARMVRQMISDMAYPMFVFNFAIVLFPFVDFMKPGGTFTKFVTSVLIVIVPLYGFIIAIALACQGRHGEAWRSKMEHILSFIPILGTARREMALSRLAMALESLLNAGVPIITAWELAGTASSSPALDRTVKSWKPEIENGATFSEKISRSPEFPQLFANLYHTGEISGTLDQTLLRLHELYQTEGQRKMRALAVWTPKLVYFGVLLYGAYMIVTSYANSDEMKMLKELEK